MKKKPRKKQPVYDLVISNLVIMYIKNLSQFVSNVATVTKKGGVVVITLPHPCFNQEHNQDWFVNGSSEPLCIQDYLTERTYNKKIAKSFDTFHVHRTLETYLQNFSQHGFEILEFLEPMPEGNHTPVLEKAHRIPFYVILVLRKQ